MGHAGGERLKNGSAFEKQDGAGGRKMSSRIYLNGVHRTFQLFFLWLSLKSSPLGSTELPKAWENNGNDRGGVVGQLVGGIARNTDFSQVYGLLDMKADGVRGRPATCWHKLSSG